MGVFYFILCGWHASRQRTAWTIKERFLAGKASKSLPSSSGMRGMLESLKRLPNTLSGQPGVMGRPSLVYQPPMTVLRPKAMPATLCVPHSAHYSNDYMIFLFRSPKIYLNRSSFFNSSLRFSNGAEARATITAIPLARWLWQLQEWVATCIIGRVLKCSA